MRRGRSITLPLDLIVNEDSVWVTDLGPLRFTKLDMTGKHLYTWMVPLDLPEKPGADKSLLIGPPWSGK